ncbi:MAG: ABC transporter ATP-binding protein [Gemmataceae bacterium]
MDEDQLNPITLRGEHLTRTFGSGDTRIVAVNRVSLAFHAGEVALLEGCTGSGKTTLLAILSGLLHPDSGTVGVQTEDGYHDLWKMNDVQREQFRLKNCGFIFQGYNLFSALTARQQLEMVVRWGEGASAAEARRRADEQLELLGIAPRAHLRPGQLSGGEKQRVAIGRALIKRPKFLFADEPTSALDWEHGEVVVQMLRNATRELGATVLLISHDPRVEQYADRIYHLMDGRLLENQLQLTGDS